MKLTITRTQSTVYFWRSCYLSTFLGFVFIFQNRSYCRSW